MNVWMRPWAAGRIAHAAEPDAQGADRRAEHDRASERDGSPLRRRECSGRYGPEGLARLPRYERAVPLAGLTRAPPRLKLGRAGELLHAVRPRPSPILLEQQIGGHPGADQKGPKEIEHDRRGDQHALVWEDKLAQKREGGGQKQEEGHPVGGAADKVPVVVDREGEFGGGGIEEPRGDLHVEGGISGEQGRKREKKRSKEP